ncbi:helix-turn-helix transcriptional regulator [Hymenobacter tibetensis]|uniref:Helix-turn-helix transcriptional regulator n=1 Tax=Hymenobacter tibetensis TaxID=497967 RepID=A0ABY4CSV1_9BACT|nr:helix-turn-helix domain-containing protein [Hymenobacter tibetensis]UOG73338.1 helix-turn-helix transcriptional regulator [Hymenobacter tibetensis]
MRKQTSTNTLNRQRTIDMCGMAYALTVVGGRWKPSILARLLHEKLRYSALRDQLTGISERMLVLQLRELEQDGIVRRIVHAEVPPRVEYELTERGQSLGPVLRSLADWGRANRPAPEPVAAT